MWAQDQIFHCGNIFRLWSKCILYCFINSEKNTILFPYPNYISPPNLAPFHLANISLKLLQVSRQQGCLWSKYHFGESNWYETYTSLYDQIMKPCQTWAQVATPFECIIQISFLDHFGQLQSNYDLSWSNSSPSYQDESPFLPQPRRQLHWIQNPSCWSLVLTQVYCSKLQRVLTV